MKMLSILLVTAAACLLPLPGHAQTLDDANRAFAAGKYHDSTLAYQALLAQKGYSAPVLFDLGNSLYREGNLAQAIVAYRRAQWLSPHDPDIAANLQLAQKQAGLSVAEPPPWEKISHLLSASDWAWVGCGAWTLLCLSLLARRILPQARTLFSLSCAAGVLLLLTALAGAALASQDLDRAVVTDKDVSALISPFPAAQAVFSPAPGETVTVQKAYNDFFLVADSAGHTGWISKTQLTPIVAAPSL